MNKLLKYHELHAAVASEAGKIDQSLTLNAWLQRTTVHRKALASLRQEMEQERDGIVEKYSAKGAEPLLQELRADFAAVADRVKAKATEDLNLVMNAKRAAVHKAMGAPSEDMVRTLQTLALRKTFSEADVAHYAAQFAGNVTALAALGDLARERGINFPTISIEKVESDLDEADAVATRMIDQIASKDDELPLTDAMSWRGAGWAAVRFPPVDRGFAAALEELPGYEPPKDEAGQGEAKPSSDGFNKYGYCDVARNGNQNICTAILTGNELAAVVATQFGKAKADIAAMNPGVDLDHLHAGQRLTIPGTGFYRAASGRGVEPWQLTPGEEPLTE